MLEIMVIVLFIGILILILLHLINCIYMIKKHKIEIRRLYELDEKDIEAVMKNYTEDIEIL